MSRLRPALPVIALWLAAATLLSARLADPPFRESPEAELHYSFDEVYWAFTAHRAAIGDPNFGSPRPKRIEVLQADTRDLTLASHYTFEHPPLPLWLMVAGIRAWGWSEVGVRAGSVLMGLLALALTALLARRLGIESATPMALILLATDGVFFVLSRTAMAHIYLTAFNLLGLYAMLRFWTEAAHRRRWLLVAGIGLGASLACKWTVLGLLVGAAVLALGRILFDAWFAHRWGTALLADLGTWLAAFLVLPAVIYVASYLPYFLTWGHTWGDFIDLQRQALRYHHQAPAIYPQTSPWYEWPWMTKPPMFYLGQSATPVPTELDRFVFCIGNPVLWWAFVPALAYVAVRFLRRRSPADGMILVGFCGTWLPWALLSHIAYMHYLVPAVPFGVLAIIVTLSDLQQRLGMRRPWLMGGYAAASILAFAHFYPVWSAIPLERSKALDGRYLNLAASDLLK